MSSQTNTSGMRGRSRVVSLAGRRAAVAVLAAAGVGALAPAAVRADQTWVGGTSVNFTDAANWNTTVPANDLTTDVAIFNTVGTFQPSMNAARSVKGVQFNNGGFTIGGTLALTTGAGGIVAANATGTNTIGAPVTLGADQTWLVAGGGTLALSGALAGNFSLTYGDATNTGTLTLAAAATRTGSATIVTNINGGVVRLNNAGALSTGTAAVAVVNAGGVLELGNVTFAQPVTLNNGGTIRAANAASRANGVITVGSTAAVTFAATAGNTLTLNDGNNDLTGGGATSTITVTGGGTVTLAGLTTATPSNNYTGNWVVDAGSTLRFSTAGTGDSTLGATTNDISLSGTLDYVDGSTTTLNAGRVVTLASSTAVINVTNAAAGILSAATANQITGANGLTKAGPGTLSLGASMNYTGATTITGGSLSYAAANAIPGGIGATGGTSNISVTGGGVLAVNFAATFARNLGTGVDQIQFTGSGGFAARGADRVVNIGGASAQIVWGTTPGFVPTGSSFYLGSTASSNTLDFQNPIDMGATNRTFAADDGAAAVEGSISGVITGTAGLTKAGAGAVALNAVNTYSGTTTVTGGTLVVTNANGIPGGIATAGGTSNITLNGGAVGINLAATFGRALGTGVDQVQFTGSGGFAAVNANRTVNLGGAAAPIVWGTTPNFVPAASSLILGTTASTHTVDFVHPLDLGGGTRTIDAGDGSAAVEGLISGVISNGALTKTGGGTIALTASNTYAGVTTVATNGGVLSVQNANALGSNAAVTVGTNAAVQLSGGITVSGKTLTMNAQSSGNVQNAGLVNGGGNNTWDGNIVGTASSNQNFRITGNPAGTNLTITGTITGSGGTFTPNTGPTAVGVVVQGAGDITITGGIAGAMGLITTNSGTVYLLNDASTFSGGIRFQGASVFVVTSFNSLNGAGTAPVLTSSSLGAPASAAANTIVFATGDTAVNAGTLRYVGPGETTNRILNLNGSTGGITLDQSSTSAASVINFTANLSATSATSGAKSLTLTGSTAGTGVFSGTIGNGAAGTLALTKNGTGTWALSGANTYSGATTVTNGRLEAANASGSATGTSAVTVNALGAIGGAGSITGTLTVQRGGRVSPGGSYASGTIGTFTTSNTVTLDPAAGTGGLPALLVKLGAASGISDKLVLSGSTTAGALNIGGVDQLDIAPTVPIGSAAQTFTIVQLTGTSPAGYGSGVFDAVTVGGVASQSTNPAGPNYVTVDYTNPLQIQITVANVAAVPEPATAGVIALAAVGLLGRRRRRA